MTPIYAAKLGLITQKTSIGAQKINDLPLKTYSMALTRFSFQNRLGKVCFCKKTFLLADTSMKVVLKKLFLVFSNPDFQFSTEKLI